MDQGGQRPEERGAWGGVADLGQMELGRVLGWATRRKGAMRAGAEKKEEQARAGKKGRPTGPKGEGRMGNSVFSFSNFSKANSKCKFKSI